VQKLLSLPTIYDLLQSALGANQSRREISNSYICAKAGDKVLDVGCGTAQIIEHLPHVHYVGFDPSKEYILAAKKKFGRIGDFYLGDVTDASKLPLSNFDRAISIGVMHHLDDDEVTELVKVCKRSLRLGGRLITVDPCISSEQSRIARYLVTHDRGRFVRTKDQYEHLLCAQFSNVEGILRDDLSRLPYTHFVAVCTN